MNEKKISDYYCQVLDILTLAWHDLDTVEEFTELMEGIDNYAEDRIKEEDYVTK